MTENVEIRFLLTGAAYDPVIGDTKLVMLRYDNTNRNPDSWWTELDYDQNPYTCIEPTISFLERYKDPNDMGKYVKDLGKKIDWASLRIDMVIITTTRNVKIKKAIK